MTEAESQDIATRSRAYREAQGLSQRQLAAKVKTSPGVIGELERGHVRSLRVANMIRELADGT